MTQSFDLKIEGIPVEVQAAALTRTMDTPDDQFSATISANIDNEPELYELIKSPSFRAATITLDGVLQFTGNITERNPQKTEDSNLTDIMGTTLPHFMDSHLMPSYQHDNLDLKQWAETVAKQTNTAVQFDTDPGGPFKRKVIERGQTAAQFLAPLAFERSKIMSCTTTGKLLFFDVAVDSKPVDYIDETSGEAAAFEIAFNDRKRFRFYKVINQSPQGGGIAIYTDENITAPRTKIIEISDTSGRNVESAQFEANKAFIEAMTLPWPVNSWHNRNGDLWQPDTTITLASPTCYFPDGFTFMIRQVDFSFQKNKKRATLHLIPRELYTKKPIIEPWF